MSLICLSFASSGPTTLGAAISFRADGHALLRASQLLPLAALLLFLPVLVALLPFTVVSSAQCLQQQQLLRWEDTSSAGWLAAGERSSVIITACLLKG